MNKDLEFCLLKFAEDQQLLHDNERQEQEQIYQSQLAEIKIQEQKLLCEQKMVTEHFEKQLMLYKQMIDDSNAQLEHEIKKQLQQHIDSLEEYVKQTIHAKEKEFAIWIEGKQQEKSNIFDENELFKFDQRFETEKEYKIKQLNDLRQAKYEQLKIERESLNDNAQEIVQIIVRSPDEKNWETNVQKWYDEKFQFVKSEKNLSSEMMTTEHKINSSGWFLSDDQSIKRISSTMLDTNVRKQKLIEEFKQKVKKIFEDEDTEFNKNIDEQIQQLNRQTNPAFVTATATTTQPTSFLSPLTSFIQKYFFDTRTEVINTNPTEMAASSTSNVAIRQKPTVESLKLAKHQHSEQLRKDYEEIISVLESSDIDYIPDRIQQWLKTRSDERFKRFEKYRQEHEEKQARCLANDQAQMIGLSCALNELAINSQSVDELKRKLKNDEDRIIEKHQQLKLLQRKIIVPVIIQQINDPKVHKLSICIRFNEDFDQWMKDADNNKLRLISSIEKQFNLPEKAFEIIAIERGSTVIRANINPPHGHQVFQQLMADGVANIGGYDTISITFGELNLNVEQERMNERYNRSYGNYPGGTHWIGSLSRGGKPYFCPKGWCRFGIKVANTQEEFDRQWGSWHIAYHGTAGANASNILISGLKTDGGCYSGTNRVVYLSPSINYSAHYRYAKPWKNPLQPGKYYQMVFQCRVNPQVVTSDKIRPQTLECPQAIRIDEHFGNQEIEWIIYPTNRGEEYITNNIICYGIMMRVCDRDPYELPESAWWQHTPRYRRTYV